MFNRSLGGTERNSSPVFYMVSSPLGPLPKRREGREIEYGQIIRKGMGITSFDNKKGVGGEEQSQRHFMVGGSLCPISFIKDA